MSVHIVKQQNRHRLPDSSRTNSIAALPHWSVWNQWWSCSFPVKHASNAPLPSCILPNCFAASCSISTHPTALKPSLQKPQLLPGSVRDIQVLGDLSCAPLRLCREGLMMWALWVNACQTFAFSKKHILTRKKGGWKSVYERLKGKQ